MSDALRVPFSVPDIDEREVDAVAAVLRSGWLTTGPQAAAFEEELGDYVNSTSAVAVSSCTAGLHVALSALGVGPGDEVITTPLTFCGTIQAIEETGARAVLADVDEHLNLDASKLEASITPRTRAILPVHIAGRPCAMDKIWDVARRHGLYVVEDAAHAVGAEYRGQKNSGQKIGGTQSDATVFSFYATKNLTTGEGGMVTSNRRDLAERIRLMAAHGITRPGAGPAWQYEVAERGFKYNLSDIQAAIGRCQLLKLEPGIQTRTRIASMYREFLAGCPEVELPSEMDEGRHAWHLYVIRLNLNQLEIDRDEFTAELARRGVGTSVHFKPIPLHPYYRDRFPDRTSLPETFRQYPRLVSVPMYPGLSDEQVELVAKSVRETVEANRRRIVAAGVASSLKRNS